MSVKVEKLEQNKVKLEFTIEKEAFLKAIDEVYKENAKAIMIPGFRKGKVPKAIVEKYYGDSIFFQDAFDKLMNEEYRKAIKDNDLYVITEPEVSNVEMSKEKGIYCIITVQLKPEITLTKYKGIEVEKVEYNVDDKDVENEINNVANENARIITVEDKEAKLKQGDISIIDFEGFVNNEAFEGGKGENYELEIGSGSFIQGFEEQLIGMKIDEEKDINVTFPEQYHAENLAGKDAVFKVKLNGIKIKELPEIDDEFAKDVSEFDTLEEYKNYIKEKLQKEKDHMAKHELENNVINKLIESNPIDVPKPMIDNEIEAKIEEIKNSMKYQGIDFDLYLQMVGQKLEDVKISLEESAKKDVAARLIIEAIIKAENIEVTEEELEEKWKEIAKKNNMEIDKLKETINENVISYYKDEIKHQKGIKFVIDNAKIK